MGENQKNLVSPPNGQSPLLKYYLQWKTKEDFWGSGWDLEGEEGNWHGDGKANVW